LSGANPAITTQAWLESHLEMLGLSSSRPRVIVHSRVWSFGKIDGGMDALHAALLKVLGPSATIVVPTYTVELTEHDIFDPETTPANAMGSYSDYVLSLDGRARSCCPIHNHAAIGTGAAAFASATDDGTNSIGPGSDFETFEQKDYDLVLLGCGFALGATYLHHLEAVANVPYRKWVDLDRQLARPGQAASLISVRYFARQDATLVEGFDTIENQMVDSGQVTKVPAPYGNSFRVPVRHLHRHVMDALARDPYLLVQPADKGAE
jgi:aminoglycoside 3-N-acetyltransferase